MQFFTESDFTPLRNPGVTSMQIVSPHNSESARVTITRVTMEPGAKQPRHNHQSSEQIWIALAGAGTLLLGDDLTRAFKAGEVARFADGDVHGFENTGAAPFVYLSVTSPPINFDYAYKQKG
jgi:quercetin dioxygenase-like cupin family protein